MKKATLFTLALLFFSTVSVGILSCKIFESRDQVVFTEKVFYGNSANANGLQIECSDTFANHLFWDTTLSFEDDLQTKTDYSFMLQEPRLNGEITYSGLYMNTSYDFVTAYDAEPPTSGLDLAYYELFQSTEPGQEKSKWIYLKDYEEYYPIMLTLDFPSSNRFEAEKLLAKKMQDYFKIPVLEEEKLEISIGRNHQGQLFSCGNTGIGDIQYFLNSCSTLTDECCYFTFNTRASDGSIIDTSELPEGYGIYSISYTLTKEGNYDRNILDIDVDSLKLCYPLNSDIKILSWGTNETKEHLLIHAIESADYVFTAINLSTMELTQEIRFELKQDVDDVLFVYDKDGFFVTYHYDANQLWVIEEMDDGTYRLALSCEISPDDMYRDPNYDTAMAFDGERLALVKQYNWCGLNVMSYDKNGLSYHAEFETSLNPPYDTYDGDFTANPAKPVEITWK